MDLLRISRWSRVILVVEVSLLEVLMREEDETNNLTSLHSDW